MKRNLKNRADKTSKDKEILEQEITEKHIKAWILARIILWILKRKKKKDHTVVEFLLKRKDLVLKIKEIKD